MSSRFDNWPLINESIVTTEARAKEIRKTVEKWLLLGKRGDLHRTPSSCCFLYVMKSHLKNYDEATDKYTSTTALQNCSQKSHLVMLNVTGGYTRILKTEPRRGDAAHGDHRIV